MPNNTINDNYEKVMLHLILEISLIIGYKISIVDCKTFHRWKYTNNVSVKQEG